MKCGKQELYYIYIFGNQNLIMKSIFEFQNLAMEVVTTNITGSNYYVKSKMCTRNLGSILTLSLELISTPSGTVTILGPRKTRAEITHLEWISALVI